MNPPARPSALPSQMADSSARISSRVRPLLRLKSGPPWDSPQDGKEKKKLPPERGRNAPYTQPVGAAPWAIPQKSAKRTNAKTSAPKLSIKESGSKSAPAWTISIGQKSGKGRTQTSFRVRGADVGFSVSLRFKDEAEKWREPYCCYLSAGEWKDGRKMTPANFTALIIGKVEERKGKEKADAAKLDDLIARIRGIE